MSDVKNYILDYLNFCELHLRKVRRFEIINFVAIKYNVSKRTVESNLTRLTRNNIIYRQNTIDNKYIYYYYITNNK